MSRSALVLIAVLAACHAGAPPPSPPTPTSALEAIYRARTDSARLNYTPADVHFMTGMIGHHRQALEMASLAESHGAGSAVVTLAARITNAQQDEIATLEQWLSDRGLPLPEPDAHLHMPGMLTPAQMRELDAARGPAFDQRFLRFMIQHHQGAVTMVHELFGTDGAAQNEAVFKLASDIQVDQITEIARMELMLQEMTPS